MIGGIYARSSLGKTRQGDTVDHQVQMIKEYSKRLEINIAFDDKFIYPDDGESGFKTTLLQRPAMKQLLEDIEAGMIDVVFFKGISRFARDSGEAIQTSKRLIQKGVRVISIEENYDSDFSDPTFFQMYAVLAEAESRKTSIRVSLGNKQKARNGLWTSSVPPLGYLKVKDIHDNELREQILAKFHPHSLFPDPEKSDIIRKIFDLYVNKGFGRKKIVSWVNSQGVKTQYGNVISDITIKRILMNPAYVGDIVYGKTRYNYVEDDEGSRKIQKVVDIDKNDWAICENAHPPIIEREIFMKAQRLLRQKEKAYNGGRRFNNAKHPLTGLLKCSLCGAPMICQKRSWTRPADKKKIEYRYYVCSTYHQKGRDVCPQANINADELESYVHKQISKQIEKVKNDEYLLEGYATYNPNEEINAQIKLIDREIEKNTNKSLTLLENKDLYDNQTFRDLNLKLKEEIVKLRKQKEELMEELKFAEDIMTKEDLRNKLDEFLDLNLNDIAETRKVFHEWINEVRVQDKKVIIDQKFRLI